MTTQDQVGLSTEQLQACTRLGALLSLLMRGDRTPDQCPTNLTEGQASIIDEEDYFFYLEMLPPRWMQGNAFAYAEGANDFILCWQRDGKSFARQMTTAETERFCELSGVSLYS